MRYLFITLIGGAFALWLGSTVAAEVKQSFNNASKNLRQAGM